MKLQEFFLLEKGTREEKNIKINEWNDKWLYKKKKIKRCLLSHLNIQEAEGLGACIS